MQIDIKLLPHQMQVINSKTYLTTMCCGIGSGKSFTAAFLTIKELLEGKRVLLIAPTRSMISDVLILQMKEILDKYNIPYKHNKITNDMKLGSGMLFCKSDVNRKTINGLTKISTVIMDECRLISEETFSYATARQRGVSNPKCYLFGTGCSKLHWFAKYAMKNSTTHITADITSNVKHNGSDYIDRMIDLYKDMPEDFIKRELYGLFTDSDEFSLFQTIKTDGRFYNGDIVGGLDIAGTGDDFSHIAIFQGNELLALEKRKTADYEELTKWKKAMTNKYNCHLWRHDATGIGNLMKWEDSTGVNFGASGNGRFLNQRARIYFDLKAKLEKGICFADDGIEKYWKFQVIPELMATELDQKEQPKIKLIDKQKIKKALGRSPDAADSLALASWNPTITKETLAKIQHAYDTYDPYDLD